MIKRMFNSWKALRIAFLVNAALCAGLAGLNGPSWLSIVYGFMAGCAASAVIFITVHIQMRGHFAAVVEAAEAMAEMNRLLIEGKVKIMLELEGVDHESAPQSLH